MLLKNIILSGLIFVCLVMFAGISFADGADSNVTVNNQPPGLPAPSLSENPVNLVPSGTKTIWCYATASDPNGGADITSASAVFWANTTTMGDPDNGANHYTVASCSLGTASGNDRPVNCSVNLQYYANNTGWTCNITVQDSGALTASNWQPFNINPSIALSLGSPLIEFGSVMPGSTSGTQNEVIANRGNDPMDVQVSGTNMVKPPSPPIPVNKIDWSLDPGMSGKSALSGSPYTITTFDLVEATDGGPSTKSIYWAVNVPTGTPFGTYTGTITITAQSS
jgi:hypothetical protein